MQRGKKLIYLMEAEQCSGARCIESKKISRQSVEFSGVTHPSKAKHKIEHHCQVEAEIGGHHLANWISQNFSNQIFSLLMIIIPVFRLL